MPCKTNQNRLIEVKSGSNTLATYQYVEDVNIYYDPNRNYSPSGFGGTLKFDRTLSSFVHEAKHTWFHQNKGGVNSPESVRDNEGRSYPLEQFFGPFLTLTEAYDYIDYHNLSQELLAYAKLSGQTLGFDYVAGYYGLFGDNSNFPLGPSPYESLKNDLDLEADWDGFISCIMAPCRCELEADFNGATPRFPWVDHLER